jgi:hypothetical protein
MKTESEIKKAIADLEKRIKLYEEACDGYVRSIKAHEYNKDILKAQEDVAALKIVDKARRDMLFEYSELEADLEKYSDPLKRKFPDYKTQATIIILSGPGTIRKNDLGSNSRKPFESDVLAEQIGKIGNSTPAKGKTQKKSA